MGNKQGKDGESPNTGVNVARAQRQSAVVTQAESSRPSRNSKNEQLNVAEENERENRQKIPRELFMKFLNCLRSFPLTISDNEFQELTESLQIVSHEKGELILQKGERGKGVFLVVEGYCEVLTVENVVIRIIEDGNYFGEISTFYLRPCSATVRAGSKNTKTLLLPDNVLDDVMKRPVEYRIFDWFVERKYLDLEDTPMKNDIVREMVKQAIEKVPPFKGWSSDSIDAIVSSIVPDKVVLHPAGADIFFCDDEDCNAFLLLQGSVEIFSSKLESLDVLDSGPTGLWFGDEQLFCPTKRQITAKAYNPCLLVILSHEDLQIITETFPIESAKIIYLTACWKRLVENRNPNMEAKYAGQFCVEMSRLMLRKSELFSLAPSGMLYHISLGISFKEVSKGNVILSNSEQRNSAFIVYSGMVMVESDSKIITRKLEPYDVFFPSDTDPDDLVITANIESVVGVFDISTFRRVEENYINAIINWKSVQLQE